MLVAIRGRRDLLAFPIGGGLGGGLGGGFPSGLDLRLALRLAPSLASRLEVTALPPTLAGVGTGLSSHDPGFVPGFEVSRLGRSLAVPNPAPAALAALATVVTPGGEADGLARRGY